MHHKNITNASYRYSIAKVAGGATQEKIASLGVYLAASRFTRLTLSLMPGVSLVRVCLGIGIGLIDV